MLSYIKYKEFYPASELTEADFNLMYGNFYIEVLSVVSIYYDLEDLFTTDTNLLMLVASQINFVYENGEYFDGIKSQSTTNGSVTYDTNMKSGDYMWSKAVKTYLLGKYGMVVYHV